MQASSQHSSSAVAHFLRSPFIKGGTSATSQPWYRETKTLVAAILGVIHLSATTKPAPDLVRIERDEIGFNQPDQAPCILGLIHMQHVPPDNAVGRYTIISTTACSNTRSVEDRGPCLDETDRAETVGHAQ
jgi:hypothetical protein